MHVVSREARSTALGKNSLTVADPHLAAHWHESSGCDAASLRDADPQPTGLKAYPYTSRTDAAGLESRGGRKSVPCVSTDWLASHRAHPAPPHRWRSPPLADLSRTESDRRAGPMNSASSTEPAAPAPLLSGGPRLLRLRRACDTGKAESNTASTSAGLPTAC